MVVFTGLMSITPPGWMLLAFAGGIVVSGLRAGSAVFVGVWQCGGPHARPCIAALPGQ